MVRDGQALEVLLVIVSGGETLEVLLVIVREQSGP